MGKALSKESRKLMKDIGIGIITTVIGATLIYFLGFHNKKPPLSKLEREDIAVDTWKTYTTVENIYIDASASLMQEAVQELDFADVSTEAAAASQKFQTSLNDIIGIEGIDKSFLSFIKSRLATDKIQNDETTAFYKKLTEEKGNWTQAPLTDTLKARFTRFAQATTARFIQSAPEIENLSKKFAKMYSLPFNINDFLVIQAAKYRKAIFNPDFEKKNGTNLPPDETSAVDKNGGEAIDMGQPAKLSKQYLVSNWQSGNASISLRADGKMSWSIPADSTEAKGNWTLKDEQLVMNITRHPVSGKPAKWVFKVSGVMTRSFTITMDTIPYKTYTLIRK
ncbi:MAG TPA: hypothetical protein VLJ68_04410 [Chitinophagaceae bacterium]|nr:hypothetical protein [Chitinophagaceae bacterium]